jgi:hypothetical protein
VAVAIWCIDFFIFSGHDGSSKTFFVASLTPEQEAEIPTLLPSLIDWAQRMEKEALSEGIALSEILRKAAMILGIKDINAVRILAVQSIPEPEHPRIVELGAALGLSFAAVDGITFGHAIFVRRPLVQDNQLLTHELVHVRQYEQAGSIAKYLPVYVHQIARFGYQNMPLEQQAVWEAAKMWPSTS